MKVTLLAATTLIASSFSPIALPPLVSGAAALPTPNVLLCNDSKLLGSSQNGHFWGNPYLLPTPSTQTLTFTGPYSSGDTEYYIGTITTRYQPVIQRCPVMNGTGHRTGRYQDVEAAPADTVVEVFNCQPELTAAGRALGYVDCPAESSGDTRKGGPKPKPL